MKIEIWSDYVCPFCYMGKKAFDEALSKFPEKEKIDVEFKSFQLEPDTPPYTGQDFYESMAYKFGGVEKTKKMMADVAKQAKERGLDYHFDTMKPANTFDAHRLMKFARAHDKDYDLSEKIFFANFTKSKDIGNSEVLAELAEDVGLNKTEALNILKDKDAFAQEVLVDIEEARQFEISSVPSFVFDRKYLLSGAQPVESFTQALTKLINES